MLETATTRQLIAVLAAISIGLVFAFAALGCADTRKVAGHHGDDAYRLGSTFTPERVFGTLEKWSGGAP